MSLIGIGRFAKFCQRIDEFACLLSVGQDGEQEGQGIVAVKR